MQDPCDRGGRCVYRELVIEASRRYRLPACIASLLVAVILPVGLAAHASEWRASADTPSVTEWPLPNPSGAWSVVAGPDGNLWFADKRNGKIGRVTTSGSVTTYSLPTGTEQPLFIADGPDGQLWFTQGAHSLGRISVSGTFSQVPLPSDAAWEITHGSDGNLWFTEISGRIGAVHPDQSIRQYSVASVEPPQSIAYSNRAVWFTESRPSGDAPALIGRMTPAGSLVEFTVPIPNPQYLEGAITAGPDGNAWFTGTDVVSRITPEGTVTHFEAPLVTTSGAGIVAAPDGNLWFGEGNGIGRITPWGLITDFPLPSGGALGVTVGPDGALWFTQSSAIGRMVLPPSPAAPSPSPTVPSPGPRASVSPNPSPSPAPTVRTARPSAPAAVQQVALASPSGEPTPSGRAASGEQSGPTEHPNAATAAPTDPTRKTHMTWLLAGAVLAGLGAVAVTMVARRRRPWSG
ncbi:MAG: hypothetical protein JWM18_2457 [Chloroflexi bacterium]|nr:hypothetical protein [Chloroflexota bacterium]